MKCHIDCKLLFQQTELIPLQSILQYFSNNNSKYILHLRVTHIFIPQHPLKLCAQSTVVYIYVLQFVACFIQHILTLYSKLLKQNL